MPPTTRLSKKSLNQTQKLQSFFTAFTKYLCVASTATSAVGTVFFVGQVGFLLSEIVMMWLFTSWGAIQLQINVGETTMSKSKAMPNAHFRLLQLLEIAVYAVAVVTNAHSVGPWLKNPLDFATSSYEL